MSFADISASTDQRADTFSFTEAERKRILNAAQALPSITPAGDAEILRELERLKRREVAWTLHSSTLSEYAKVQRIPRGLRLHIKPGLFREDKDFVSRWQCILNKCSLDLITLTVQQLQNGLRETRQQIHTAEEELKAKDTMNTVKTTLAELQVRIDTLEQEILQSKLRKFKRDTKDYERGEVYTWKTTRKAQYTRQPRSTGDLEGAYSQQSSDSDSISGTSAQSSPAFLGQRQSNTREPGGAKKRQPAARKQQKLRFS
ncbi:uncharacterized protein LOC121400656 [Xenopus laevis]|uniref:Uncharacterized protein LOC121400656 n=1 Tax=Xenopus laevis TaxID=8355 RepID=A0A8J1MFK4_XENLA|nr:uncharacterized protein LOC121400656 [Xenopus laevis]XP_041440172.1 uncharacterized protein LOC121400656 [Xenopus laevis]